MKNNTTKRISHNLPSQKTCWAYFMQAIEPKSEALNKAFPDFHPQWVSMSQVMNVAPENFTYLRRAMGMTTSQCAAYLRVTRRTISNWESGAVPVQFSAFELLRIVFESTSFKFSHKEWDGWFISDEGRLVSPDVACSFSPGDLNYFSFNRSEAAKLANETYRLQSELDKATAENTRLRQLFLSQGLVDELAAMKDHVNRLVALVATAKVIPFPTATDQLQEKTA
jgi:DNA-binding transcriptional regulator YiaG